MRSPATDWEKIFATDTDDKRPSFKIYEEHLKVNAKETLNSIKNGPKT